MVTRLGLELIVVFVGVYAAFALSEYESDQDAAFRRRQLQSALITEIKDITASTRNVAIYLPLQLASFDSAAVAGGRPPLQPWIEPIRIQTHMWEATLQSGGVDLFDVPTVYQISKFYNELNGGFEQLAQLRQLSETLLIPALGLGSDEFYDRNNRLRPKYQWHRDGLQRLASLAANITLQGDSLVALLTRTAQR